MPRATYTDLHSSLGALQRATGVAPGRLGIEHSNGRHRVILWKDVDGQPAHREVSPSLSLGDLQDWLWAAIRGAYLLREDGFDEKVAVLLDTGCDWPEVVLVGTHDEAGTFVRNTVLPALEAEGDEAIYYTTAAIVSVESALEHRRSKLLDQ